MLRARVAQAVADEELAPWTDPDTVTGLVQAVWHGLSVESGRGIGRERLLAVAGLARESLLAGSGSRAG